MKKLSRVLLIILIVTTPLWSYVTKKLISADNQIVQQRWKPGAFPIQWRMNPVRGANVTGSREQAEVLRTSFQKWQQISTASIAFSEGSATDANVRPGLDGINLITSNVTANEYASSALGLTITYAYDTGGPDVVNELGQPIEFAGQIVEADVMFNPGSAFTTNTTVVSDRYDFESVAVHEIGHFLGLDHTGILGSTMYPRVGTGLNFAKTLSVDDTAGVSTIYPSSAAGSKGSISGAIRTTGNAPVYGAIVVAVNSNGVAVSSAVTNPSGQYTITGLDAGNYTVYAEPLDSPIAVGDIPTLTLIYPGQQVNVNFTTRFR